MPMPDSAINETQFEALFRHATIGMIVTDSKGIIIDVNSLAENQFSYTENELRGKSVDILVPMDSQRSHFHHRNAFYHHPAPRRMGEGRDLFAQRKDGSQFPVEISLSYYSVNGQLFVIAFIIDITVRKKQEGLVLEQKEELERVTKEITHLNQELEQKVQARTNMLKETMTALQQSKEELSAALQNEKDLGELKSRFVTMASHEFRTPLSTILSSAFLIEKYNSPGTDAKRLKHTERIKNAVADLKNILEDFLSLGKLDEGLVTARMEPFTSLTCQEEIKGTISELEVSLKNNQKIHFVAEGDHSAKLDKAMLKNVVTNLVSNAIKFSPEDAVINVSAIFRPHEFSLIVKDAGIGIPEADLERLFNRFFRAGNAINIQGTGLGLHIVARYLELMQGTIEVESKLDKGTTFTIHIPQHKTH